MLPCGHNEACMYRYRHRGVTMKYCFACIAETFPKANVDNMFKKLREKEKVAKRTSEEVKQGQKETRKAEKKIAKEETKKKLENENKQKQV